MGNGVAAERGIQPYQLMAKSHRLAIPVGDLPGILARFMGLVDKLPNGCWFWTGGRSRGKGNRKWYGSFWVNEVIGTIRAHRFASDVIAGMECPPGFHRDHKCHFSLCVNPDHIEIVTHAENQERKMRRRK